MKLLILGANGMLGNSFKSIQSNFPSYEFIFKSKKELNLLDANTIAKVIKEQQINCIVNCAAYTNVNDTSEKISLAKEINATAVGVLAKLAKELAVKMIHFSTDYVFDGKANRPYPIAALTNPINDYGKTKLQGELLMKEVNPKNSVIIRTSWLYDAYSENFVTKILGLAKNKGELSIVNDQFGSPTYAPDLAFATLTMLPMLVCDGVKTYHFANQGFCTWHEFAKEFLTISKLTYKVNPVSSSEFPSKVARPAWSVLDTKQIQQEFNLRIPHWKTSLTNCMHLIMNKDFSNG